MRNWSVATTLRTPPVATSAPSSTSPDISIVLRINSARSISVSIRTAMFREWKLAPNTLTQRLAALRFFYVQTLKRGWSVAETPYPKKAPHLPEILSQEEVARLIDAVEFPFHRILLMTLYTLQSLACHPESRSASKCWEALGSNPTTPTSNQLVLLRLSPSSFRPVPNRLRLTWQAADFGQNPNRNFHDAEGFISSGIE
jgi:hypothetical protein